jgi:epoxyqueuosine reductase
MEKSEKIKKIIDAEFDIDTYEGKSAVIFYIPYAPYKFGSGQVSADSFYRAYNTAYYLARDYAAKLNAEGIPCAPNPSFDYKAAAERRGLSRGKNTLMYKNGIGSRFAIGAVSLSGEIPAGESVPPQDICGNCDICVKACPVSAINGDMTLSRALCVRTYMLRPEKAGYDVLKAFGGSVLGCDICQKVCPLNKVKATEPPEDLGRLLIIENLYDKIKQGDLSLFAKYFGSNYSNKNSLLSMLLIAAANIGHENYLLMAKENLGSESDRVKYAAQYALGV